MTPSILFRFGIEAKACDPDHLDAVRHELQKPPLELRAGEWRRAAEREDPPQAPRAWMPTCPREQRIDRPKVEQT